MSTADPDARLDAAMDQMTAEGPGRWELPILRLYGPDPAAFFALVDRARALLTGPGLDTRRVRKPQEATSLRRALPPYFEKAHLAVALVELGYRVIFEDPGYLAPLPERLLVDRADRGEGRLLFHFKTTYPAQRVGQQLRRTVSARDGSVSDRVIP